MSDSVVVALITSGGILAAAVLAAVIARWPIRRVRARVDAVEVKVDRVKHDTEQINEAVNHKAHGMPTLVQRVVDQDAAATVRAEDLATETAWQAEALEAIAAWLELRLPPRPAPVEPNPAPIP